jgi:hypothetical protein
VAEVAVGLPRGATGRDPTDPAVLAVRAEALAALRGAMEAQGR